MPRRSITKDRLLLQPNIPRILSNWIIHQTQLRSRKIQALPCRAPFEALERAFRKMAAAASMVVMMVVVAAGQAVTAVVAASHGSKHGAENMDSSRTSSPIILLVDLRI